ncbi:MAG TPA: cytochrome c oxidase subunit II [Longimicrobiales bacterium]|nr:cytochrome c oxidase subunit II [Longimicrobiales bacterium]
MWRGLPFFPEQASTLAREVDALYFFLLAVTAFFSTLIAVLVIVFVLRYRRRSERDVPPAIHGSLALELTWTLIPLAILLGVFVWSAKIFYAMFRPPAGSMNVYVVGKRWMWKAQHLTGQREINELHVPVGVPVRLHLTSEDVIHSFFVPAFRVKRDVIPGRYTSVWFEATRAGRYHLFCAEFCGTKHSQMIGSIVVMEPDDFQQWLAGGATGSMASAGEKLFSDLGCGTCHRPDSLARGPSLQGLFGGPVRLVTGEVVTADESYVREAIVNPSAKVVEGFQPVMPTYQGLIGEEGLMQLIAYIQSLGEAGSRLGAPSPAPGGAAAPASSPSPGAPAPGGAR